MKFTTLNFGGTQQNVFLCVLFQHPVFRQEFTLKVLERHSYLNLCVWSSLPEKVDKQNRVIKAERDMLLGHVSLDQGFVLMQATTADLWLAMFSCYFSSMCIQFYNSNVNLHLNAIFLIFEKIAAANLTCEKFHKSKRHTSTCIHGNSVVYFLS